jgi:hypothetical protein
MCASCLRPDQLCVVISRFLPHHDSGRGLTLSLGLGVGTLAGVPVAMVVIGITLVGLPISLMLLAVYLTGVYLAKIWVGAYLGRILLRPSGATKRDWVLGLLGVC